MGILRNALSFDEQFARIPNAWLRDQRLSRKARGLLGEIMSHRAGWHITVASLVKNGNEGVAAVRSGLQELREAGYLVVKQGKSEGGTWETVTYQLADPHEMPGQTASGLSASGSPASGSSASGQSHPKKTRDKEDQREEDHLEELLITAPAAIERDYFEEFWKAYPRKVGKAGAEKVFAKAAKKTDPEEIIAGALRFARDPNLPEKQFIAHPSTWLNRGSWADEPLPVRAEDAPQRGYVDDMEWAR